MAKGSTRDFDRQLERMIRGNQLLMLAPETNNGRVLVHVDGDQIVLVPGQSLTLSGRGLVVSCERGGDSCHITIT